MAKTRGIYHPPTVFALDETANIAPIPDLPTIVSQGGSQGVVVAAVFQHLGQAKPRWGQDGEGFLTTFQERLMFPGIWQTTPWRRSARLSATTTGPRPRYRRMPRAETRAAPATPIPPSATASCRRRTSARGHSEAPTAALFL